MSRRHLVICLAAALALRLLWLGAAQLWYDEAGAVWMAHLPLRQLSSATAGDTHPPVYFVLLAAVIRLLGESEFVYRLPSALLSTAAVWLTWKLAEALAMPRRAVAAGVWLMALAPLQLHFAQEARMYALLEVEALIMLLAALSGRWGLMALAGVALLYTHNYGLFFFPVIGALGLWWWRPFYGGSRRWLVRPLVSSPFLGADGGGRELRRPGRK